MSNHEKNRRILLVDDNQSIHEDFRKILSPADASQAAGLMDARAAFLGASSPAPSTGQPTFELDSALQGQAAHEMVRVAIGEGRPFALAFVDMRMPPGLNGIETIAAIWNVDPAIQVVLSTAYSDFTWVEVKAGVGRTEGLHLLRKPFHHSQVRQFAGVLARKWQLERREPQSSRRLVVGA